MIDTEDLVQTTLQRSLERLQKFTPKHEGAFLSYLRKTLRNLIRDEVRKAMIRGMESLSSSHLIDDSTSPLEAMIGTQLFEIYDRALHRLRPRNRYALYLRIEFQYSYGQIAGAIGCPTENAARLLVSRSLVRLAMEMNALGGAKEIAPAGR